VSGNCGVPLVEFLQYAQNTRAAFPLYLVEAQFVGERAPLLQDFVTPEPFRDDVRSLVLGNGRKNPHWFLGGPRSGTFLHVDPRR
jgi:histone arginine demethylase JMJD6